MLTSLSIHNVVLIEKLVIEFKSGLCALTGETGAGKSILLDSLGLALGARSESKLIRKGADQAIVVAVFEAHANHPAREKLKDSDIMIAQGEDLILRRTLGKDGRSKAHINDQPVSIKLLKQVGDSLIEIHGQFDTQGLLDISTHRKMLDEYAQIDGRIKDIWNAWQSHHDHLVEMRENAKASRAEEEYLRTALEDLDSLEPQTGEEKELSSIRERLMNKEQVLEGLNAAYQALNTEEDPVRSAWATIDRIADKLGPQAQPLTSALDLASTQIQEAVSEIQILSTDLQSADHDLQTVDDRLFALRAQARKHDCELDELPQIREKLAHKLNAIEHADEAIAEAMQEVEKSKAQYISKAEKVSTARAQAAGKLDRLVSKELAPLKLEKARFVTFVEKLDESEWGPNGFDKVTFLVATNPGAEPGPLKKIASGGEMSRFMLALKVVMAKVGAAESLIFDEVDAGIGGSAADAVGERLAKLSSDKQILVVTHAPQVAARASHHWIVKKQGQNEAQTSVNPLQTARQRREEIARMLAGATITQEARAAADKLLELGEAA